MDQERQQIEIIAEIAGAHQGDPDIALELARAAIDSNAGAVKFQIFFADELLVKSHPKYEHFKSRSFSEKDWNMILSAVKATGLKVYADVFGMHAYGIAVNNKIDGFKVHSTDLMNTKILTRLATQEKKIFLATGGSTILEIKYAVEKVLQFVKPSEVILMHGFQAFPTKVEDSVLSRIGKLRDLFGKTLKYGYSDHADADTVFAQILPMMAIPFGVTYLEKHITFDREKKGTDYYSSLNPQEFKEFVNNVRLAEQSLGEDPLKFSSSEKNYRAAFKKGWVVTKNIKSGSKLGDDLIEMKRIPDFKASPVYEEIINNPILNNKDEESPITRLDLPHKVLAIIVARSASSRLPNKALIDLNGKPVISHLLERVGIAHEKGYVNTIAFCTTVDRSDDRLAEIARGYQCKVYRGSVEDVLSRMMLAINDNSDHDLVLRITGDDILIDCEYLQKTVEHHLKECSDYTDAKALPSGVEVEVFNASTLRLIYDLSRDSSGTEYLTNYIRNNEDQFITASLPVEGRHSVRYRLTMDTPEDFEVIKKLLRHMQNIGKEYTYSLDDISDFFEQNTELLKINEPVRQKSVPHSVDTVFNWHTLTKKPLVTVYITNYNYGKYLPQSIESVLNQKFKDFELIIIDDGSTDNSKEIIETYRYNHKIKFVYQQNKGLNTSNNIAINLSQGKYIVRLDADDYLDENALLVMVNQLDQDPNLAMVFPDYYLVDKDGNVFAQERRHNFQNVLVKDQPAHGACTMIRKEVLVEAGSYCEDFSCQDGYDIWVKFINNNNKVGNINLPLFYYRQHDSNLTKNQEKILATRHEIIKKNIDIDAIRLKKHIAIIPVRGGEDEVPVALRPFAGATMLDITISGVTRSENISSIIIVTADERVMRYVKECYGERIVVLERPQVLSGLNVKLEGTIDYMLRCHPYHFEAAETISLLNYEYPLRKHIYTDKAINTLYLYGVDSILSVKQRNANFYRHEGAGLIPFDSNKELRLERNIIYEETGGIHTFSLEAYRKSNSILTGRVGHVIIDEESSMRVLTERDFELAEYLYEKMYG